MVCTPSANCLTKYPAHGRFVTHIDDAAINSIKTFYKAVFDQAPQGEYSVLDLCSSWISHYPDDLNASMPAELLPSLNPTTGPSLERVWRSICNFQS